ncbi:uncharacterized protein SOCE26_038230 [Sorangium cellulosum]|uniref:Uncharacterized protein n=1 Tax=Sorangium cellulosum TaxID=56 RepID=A0A2L0ET05_SORCE|nr:uncharacterized protein SOCE26_038230 [Sorangium cellulosum]
MTTTPSGAERHARARAASARRRSRSPGEARWAMAVDRGVRLPGCRRPPRSFTKSPARTIFCSAGAGARSDGRRPAAGQLGDRLIQSRRVGLDHAEPPGSEGGDVRRVLPVARLLAGGRARAPALRARAARPRDLHLLERYRPVRRPPERGPVRVQHRGSRTARHGLGADDRRGAPERRRDVPGRSARAQGAVEARPGARRRQGGPVDAVPRLAHRDDEQVLRSHAGGAGGLLPCLRRGGLRERPVLRPAPAHDDGRQHGDRARDDGLLRALPRPLQIPRGPVPRRDRPGANGDPLLRRVRVVREPGGVSGLQEGEPQPRAAAGRPHGAPRHQPHLRCWRGGAGGLPGELPHGRKPDPGHARLARLRGRPRGRVHVRGWHARGRRRHAPGLVAIVVE